jgi:hypothetical protein
LHITALPLLVLLLPYVKSLLLLLLLLLMVMMMTTWYATPGSSLQCDCCSYCSRQAILWLLLLLLLRWGLLCPQSCHKCFKLCITLLEGVSAPTQVFQFRNGDLHTPTNTTNFTVG